EMLAVSDRIVDTLSTYRDEESEYWYANSEGARLHEVRPEVTLSGTATSRGDGTIDKGHDSIGQRPGWDAEQGEAAGVRTVGERATGNARAISFRHPPIVRMTNTYIGNGRGTFADLIRDIKLGVYACGAFGGQTMLENFSFTAAYGHMIRDGQVTELVKDVVLAGNLFQTLDRIDHIAGDFRWNQMGGGCGKGGQYPLPVTEGASLLRIEAALIGGDVPPSA